MMARSLLGGATFFDAKPWLAGAELLDGGGRVGAVANPDRMSKRIGGNRVSAFGHGNVGFQLGARRSHLHEGQNARAAGAKETAPRAVKGHLVDSRGDGKGLDEATGAGIKHRKLAVATRDEEAMAGFVQLQAVRRRGARFPTVRDPVGEGVNDGDFVFVFDVEVDQVCAPVERQNLRNSGNWDRPGQTVALGVDCPQVGAIVVGDVDRAIFFVIKSVIAGAGQGNRLQLLQAVAVDYRHRLPVAVGHEVFAINRIYGDTLSAYRSNARQFCPGLEIENIEGVVLGVPYQETLFRRIDLHKVETPAFTGQGDRFVPHEGKRRGGTHREGHSAQGEAQQRQRLEATCL